VYSSPPMRKVGGDHPQMPGYDLGLCGGDSSAFPDVAQNKGPKVPAISKIQHYQSAYKMFCFQDNISLTNNHKSKGQSTIYVPSPVFPAHFCWYFLECFMSLLLCVCVCESGMTVCVNLAGRLAPSVCTYLWHNAVKIAVTCGT